MSAAKNWILAVDDWIALGSVPDKDAPSMQALERLEADGLLSVVEIQRDTNKGSLLVSWTPRGRYEVERLRAGGALPIRLP